MKLADGHGCDGLMKMPIVTAILAAASHLL